MLWRQYRIWFNVLCLAPIQDIVRCIVSDSLKSYLIYGSIDGRKICCFHYPIKYGKTNILLYCLDSFIFLFNIQINRQNWHMLSDYLRWHLQQWWKKKLMRYRLAWYLEAINTFEVVLTVWLLGCWGHRLSLIKLILYIENRLLHEDYICYVYYWRLVSVYTKDDYSIICEGWYLIHMWKVLAWPHNSLKGEGGNIHLA